MFTGRLPESITDTKAQASLKAAKQIGVTIPPNVLCKSGSCYPINARFGIPNSIQVN